MLKRYRVRPKNRTSGRLFFTLHGARHELAFQNTLSALGKSNTKFEIYDRKLKRVVS